VHDFQICVNFTEGSVWKQKKARQLSVNVPDGRIVSRVQVELTAVKMCIYESDTPPVNFEFGETSNDPHPLFSSIYLSDSCGCNVCPVSQDGSDWDATGKQWRDPKMFTLDVHFDEDEGNSTLCIKTLTIRIQFACESSVVHCFVYSHLIKWQI
jgi:hypothetical protein